MRSLFVISIFAAAILRALPAVAQVPATAACPAIEKVPDYNCDGKVVVVFFGDSVTTGYGDEEIGNKEGGYIARAEKILPQVEFINLAEQGERSPYLMEKLTTAFSPRPSGLYAKIYQSLLIADYVVLDVGRNDHWYRNAPAWTIANLRYSASMITAGVKKAKKQPPLIVTPNFTVPDRDSQREWVRSLNRLLLRANADTAPTDLRLDQLELTLLRYDKIHPTSPGYAKLASILTRYLTSTLARHVQKIRAKKLPVKKKTPAPSR